MSSVDKTKKVYLIYNGRALRQLREQIKRLPDEPGVYLFKKGKSVLYVGKAMSIRDRVRSYFTSGLLLTRSPLVAKVIEEADAVDFQQTDSVLEALVLEANLIKKHKPKGNTLQKDDKSYNYIVFTNEEYPRVFTVRGRELQTKYDPDEFKYVFGPYPSGSSLKEALKIIRRIFPFRGMKDPVELKKKDSPLNRQLGLTPDFRSLSKREYVRLIQNLRLFFQGKKQQLLKKLEREMHAYARAREFEKAEITKRTIYALQHIRDVSLMSDEFLTDGQEGSGFRIEGYDVAHTQGKDMVGVMVVVEDGSPKKQSYRKFNIKSVTSSDDTKALKELLQRRLSHTEWQLPKLFVVDGGKQQFNITEKVLKEAGVSIPVVAVTKGEGHKPQGVLSSQGAKKYLKEHERGILIANAEAHRFAISWHRQKQRKRLK